MSSKGVIIALVVVVLIAGYGIAQVVPFQNIKQTLTNFPNHAAPANSSSAILTASSSQLGRSNSEMVSQPIAVDVYGIPHSLAVGELTGCDVSPSTIAFNDSIKIISALSSCDITVKAPSGNQTSRYEFTTGNSLMVSTCSAGMCHPETGIAYLEFAATLSYSIVGGGSPTPPVLNATQFGSKYTPYLTETPQVYWLDSGSFCSIDFIISSSLTERWIHGQIASPSAAGFPCVPGPISGSADNAHGPYYGGPELPLIGGAFNYSVVYYHQYALAYDYKIFDGFGSGYLAPTLACVAFGQPAAYALNTTFTLNWCDDGSTWTLPCSLASTLTSPERWATSQEVNGTVTGASTTQFDYYDQYSVTFSYQIPSYDAPFSNSPSFNYIDLGKTIYSVPLTTVPTAFWLDAGSGWSVNNPFLALPSQTEWYGTPGSGTSTAAGATIVIVFAPGQ